jgi:UDP-2,3-diacylglucosamine pyrophosphatase LpxH
MNGVIKDINISVDKPVILVPISDVHIGHADHNKKLFTDTVKWIKNNNAYTVLLGDLIDGISQKDRRFENDSIADDFKDHLDNLHYRQCEVFLKGIMPIKDNVIAVMGGNHEQIVKKNFGFDPISVIAQRIGKPILTDPAYVVLRFHDGKATKLYNIFCSHGDWMGGRKRGSKVNNMEDKIADFDFDMICAGHTHDKWVSTRKTIVPVVGRNNNITLDENRKIIINTGSFVSTYTDANHDTWASRKVFSPQSAGVVRCDFYLKRNKTGSRYLDVHTRI